MAVIHILKDGSRPPDLRGHVVRIADAEPLYRFIHSINQKSVQTINTYASSKNEVRVGKISFLVSVCSPVL